MGNCTAKGTTVDCSSHRTAMKSILRDGEAVIRIMTDSCRVLEYKGPIRVGDIISKFPRHGIFRQGDVLSPLLRHELLIDDQVYFLLPLVPNAVFSEACEAKGDMVLKQKAAAKLGSSTPAFDIIKKSKVLPSSSNGIWRVKLAVNAEQLANILSEQVDTEALIERMRVIARSVDAPHKSPSVAIANASKILH